MGFEALQGNFQTTGAWDFGGSSRTENAGHMNGFFIAK